MNTVISRPNHNKLYSVIEFASAVRLCKYIGIDIYIDIYAYIYIYVYMYIYIYNKHQSFDYFKTTLQEVTVS